MKRRNTLSKVTCNSYLEMERGTKVKKDFSPKLIPLPSCTFLYSHHPFQMLSSTFIPLPLAKCCEDLCLFELSLKQGVRHSTANKQQCVSPAELCCHCQQKCKTSHTQNWAKHLRMYKGAFLFHLSAFLFHLQQRGCSWDGTSVVSIATVRERLTNVMTPRTGTSAGGFQLLQL